MKRALSLIFLLLCIHFSVLGAQPPQNVPVHSEAMGKDISTIIMLPDDYDGQKRYPTLYLLHGWHMKNTEWLRVQRELPDMATRYGIILVCPDGANSWYWDSPINPAMRYETFVARELPRYMDEHYSVIPARACRAITGLSMGGHGALWIALHHQETFGACGSMSGGVDIRRFPNNWNIQDALGSYEENPQRWADYTVMTQLHLIRPGLAIIIDCGTDDFFYEVNENLHRALLERKIPHDYISRPGAHNARYWRNSILYQLLYFAEHFRNSQQESKE